MEENAGDKNKRSGFILKVFWRSLPDFVAGFVARQFCKNRNIRKICIFVLHGFIVRQF